MESYNKAENFDSYEFVLIHKIGPNLNDRGSSFPLSILQ